MPVAAPPIRRPLAVVLLLVAVALVAAAALAGGRSSRPASPYRAAHESVCSAAALAAAGDASGARRSFTNGAHEPLHRLAAETTAAGERASAARLLEAKDSVENALDGGAPRLAAELQRLAGATAAAMEAVEGRAPERCRR